MTTPSCMPPCCGRLDSISLSFTSIVESSLLGKTGRVYKCYDRCLPLENMKEKEKVGREMPTTKTVLDSFTALSGVSSNDSLLAPHIQ